MLRNNSEECTEKNKHGLVQNRTAFTVPNALHTGSVQGCNAHHRTFEIMSPKSTGGRPPDRRLTFGDLVLTLYGMTEPRPLLARRGRHFHSYERCGNDVISPRTWRGGEGYRYPVHYPVQDRGTLTPAPCPRRYHVIAHTGGNSICRRGWLLPTRCPS